MSIDIDALKVFVDLWVHLSFANFVIFDLKRQLKLLEMACDQVQTCLIFPLRWAGFPIKIGQNGQWVLDFDGFRWISSGYSISMDFDEFSIIYLIF